MNIRAKIYQTDIFNKIKVQKIRDEWVISEIAKIKDNAKIIDIGCGSQRYRRNCQKLRYFGQDIAEYTTDSKTSLESSIGGKDGYQFGPLDYISSMENIPVKDASFDAILCTEVFEHAKDPVRAIPEFNRIIRTGGKLILTLPSSTVRHMDPYYYYSGFSDNWINYHLSKNGFEILKIEPVLDYYSLVSLEIARIASRPGILNKIFLFPAFMYLISKKATPESIATQCYGYHVLAEKK